MASRIVGIPTSRLRNYAAFVRDPLQFYRDLVPLGDVVSLRTDWVQPSYIFNSPEFIQELLVTKEKSMRKGRTSAVLRRTIGDGLLTAEQAEHERQKKYMLPLFYKERIDTYARLVVEETRAAAAELRGLRECELHDVLMQLTLNIIARAMFVTNVTDARAKARLAAAVTTAIEQSAATLFKPYTLPLRWPTPGNRRHRQAIAVLEQMVTEIIADARSNPAPYEMSLVGLLLDTRYDDGTQISDREIRDQMITMLVAGHETTANLLGWIYYELANHPQYEQAIRDEVADIPLDQLASRTRELTLTNEVIQEGLRMYPPAWLIYREAREEVVLLGETFRKHSTFVICPYALQRNAAVFEQPDRFMPERWRNRQYPKFTYFPFGGGSRSCIGSRFALMEAALILATFAKEGIAFKRITDKPVIPEPLISLRVKDGLQMRIET